MIISRTVANTGLSLYSFNNNISLLYLQKFHLKLFEEITERPEIIEIPCNSIHKYSSNDSCRFIKETLTCASNDGFINYLEFLYCFLPTWLMPLGMVLYFAWLFLLFIALGTTADDFFCPALAVISKTLKLTQNIAGVTLLAFGNGSPDIFAAIAVLSDTNSSDTSLAVGALFGAGIFVTTVVAGSVCISTPFQLMERPFLRDVIFYLSAVFWTFTILYRMEITMAQAIGFIGLYVCYVIVVLAGGYIHKKYEKPTKSNVYTIEGDINGSVAHLDDESSHLEDDIDTNYIRTETRRRSRSSSLKIRPFRAISDFANIAENVTVASVLGGDAESNPALVTNKFLDSINSLTAITDQINQDKDDSTESIYNDESLKVNPIIEFLYAISPIDPSEWMEMRWYLRLFDIIKAPILLLLKITTPVVDETEEDSNWCKYLNVLHCITGPMLAVFAIFGKATINDVVPVWSVVLGVGVLLALVVFFTSKPEEPPVYHKAFAYMGFIVAIVWIYTVANEIVNLLQTFGVFFNISNAVLGLTFLAWGNSLGDFLTDIMMARQGFPRMAISACFGGPLFNLLLGLGIPLTIATIKNNGVIKITYSNVQMILALFLGLSLLSSLVILPLRRFHASRGYGLYLIAFYIIFLTVALLTEFKIINF